MTTQPITRRLLTTAAALLLVAAPLQAWDVLDGQQLAAPQGMQVEGRGTVSAVTGTCPSVVLTIMGVPVTVNASTIFAAGQSCGQLGQGVQVEVRGTLTMAGGAMAVTASTIEIEDGAEVEGEGRITALGGTCPTQTITVDGITVTVDALTRFAPVPAGCDSLRVGTKVKVKAVPAPGGGYRARLITVKSQRDNLEGESRITSVSGTCPNLTVNFGEIAVQLNGATVIQGASCGSLQAGMRAHVNGFRDDNGPITALRVGITARRVRGGATVSQVSGTCPALSLLVQGVRVSTNASTKFEDGTCSSIVPGTRVEVEGDMLAADGSVLAEELEIKGQPGGSGSGGSGSGSGSAEQVEGEGYAASVTGSCPTRSFTVNGVAASTTAATVYEDGTCADLANGRKVEVKGTRQNGAIVAWKIEFKS